MDISELEKFNEWWINGKVRKSLLVKYKRILYYGIEKNLDNRFIVLIYGLRRMGKTTIIYQLIDHLLKNKNKMKILYFI